MNSTEPTLNQSLAALSETVKVVHQALDREYYERRDNLVNAGMSQHTRYIFPSLQNEVREFVTAGPFTSEQKQVLQFAFSTWKPTPVAKQVRTLLNI
jgi:hypothetical protein